MMKTGRKTYALVVISEVDFARHTIQDSAKDIIPFRNSALLPYECMGTCNNEAEESFAKVCTK